MLVDNKFLYISLPRCGSTSFHYSCIVNGIDVKNLDTKGDFDNSKIDFNSMDESDIMNFIQHAHEPLSELQKKFGYDLPIISVSRNKYDRFYSLYKHIIFDLDRIGLKDLSYKFSKFTLDELFFFSTDDIMTKQNRHRAINEYLFNMMPELKYNDSYRYINNIIDILLTPLSHWHIHHKNIIWFSIDEMDKLEEWVSNITNTEFKLKHVNSSSFIETDIQLDSNFMLKYDSIYEYYESPKSNKSII
jgi:hypothetical protein